MTAQEVKFANFFETTLAAIVGASDGNLTLAAAPTSNGSSAISPPFYLVIDPDNETNKEVVFKNYKFNSVSDACKYINVHIDTGNH